MCNVIFDGPDDEEEVEELLQIALMVLSKRETALFNALYSHKNAGFAITLDEMRKPLRAVYLQSFDYLVSESTLDHLCDLYMKWWKSVGDPSAPKVTLEDITIAHNALTIPDREYLNEIYNPNTLKDMYK